MLFALQWKPIHAILLLTNIIKHNTYSLTITVYIAYYCKLTAESYIHIFLLVNRDHARKNYTKQWTDWLKFNKELEKICTDFTFPIVIEMDFTTVNRYDSYIVLKKNLTYFNIS